MSNNEMTEERIREVVEELCRAGGIPTDARPHESGAAFGGTIYGGVARSTRSRPSQGGMPVYHEDEATRAASHEARSQGQLLSPYHRRPREDVEAERRRSEEWKAYWEEYARQRPTPLRPNDPFAGLTPEQQNELAALLAAQLTGIAGELPAEAEWPADKLPLIVTLRQNVARLPRPARGGRRRLIGRARRRKV